MHRKETDRALTRWVLKCLAGPMSVLSLVAFNVGYWWPQTVVSAKAAAVALALDEFLSMRTAGVEFASAAYLYWFVFCLTFALHAWWMHREAKKNSLHATLLVVAQTNLTSGRWNPRKYTLRGGYLRLILFATTFISLFVLQLLTRGEPSYCTGCESSSALGFILINWAGMHVLALFSYVMLVYLFSWKSIRATVET